MINEESVRLVRLTTGEEFICEYAEDASGVATLEHRIMFVNGTDRNTGRQGIQPVPYPVFSDPDKPLSLEVKYIMFTCEVAEQFLEGYKQIFSPIVEAPMGLKLPEFGR